MNKFNYLSFTKEYGLYLLMILVGAGLMLGGVVAAKRQIKNEVAIKDEPRVDISTVTVDVSGAVVKPGVYRLTLGSRVSEVLEVAGGLSKEADTEYVSRQINLAEVLTDGAKIYIPIWSEQQVAEQTLSHLISINRSSKEELQTLWGVAEARSETIITNRPYGSIEELVTKAGLPQTILDKNQGKIGL